MRALAALLLAALLAACGGGAPPDPDARIAALGDSVMAWNHGRDAAIGDAASDALGRPVATYARAGATLLGRDDPIGSQYVPAPRDWVILNGGANDFSAFCGCDGCGGVLDRLISADGRRGALPDLIARIRGDGARVVFVGYYRAPPARLFFRGCEDEFDALDARVLRLAARDPGVLFVSAKRVIDPADASLFALDRVHPSRTGSARIGRDVAATIRAAEGASSTSR